MSERQRNGNGQFAPGSNGTTPVGGITEEEFDHAFREAEADMERDHGPEGSVPAFAEQVPDSAATPAPPGYGGAAFSGGADNEKDSDGSALVAGL